MTSRREQLQERYEDALFALLMEDYLLEMGRRDEELNERLQHSDEIQISEEFDQRIFKLIRDYTNEQQRKRNRKRIAKIAKRAAIVVCAVGLLTMSTFAAFPEWRLHVANWWMQVTDTYTDVHFSGDTAEGTAPHDFAVTWVPDGFTLASETVLPDFVTEYKYIAADDAYFYVMQVMGDNTTFSIDTEDADIKNIKINGNDAVFTQKAAECTVTWEQQDTLMRVVAVGLAEADVIQIAQGVLGNE